MKRLLAVGAVLAGAVLGGASFAWACTNTTGPFLNSLSPNAGNPETQTVVSGGGWTDGAISIRWASPTGTQIGTASGPSFSSRVTIPANATRGQVTYVYAVQAGVSRATPFEVKAAPKSTTDDGSNQGGSSSGSTSGGTEESEADTGTGSGTTSSGTGGSNTSTNTGTQSGQPVTATQSGGMPTPAANTATADSGTNTATAGRTATATSPRTGAPAPRTADAATAPADATPAPADEATAESLRSSASNLWSGFADDPSARRLTSLDDLQGSESGTPGVAIALALFTGGLLALLGGFGLAEARRRKVTAGARSSTGSTAGAR